jgi:hypothetical protein
LLLRDCNGAEVGRHTVAIKCPRAVPLPRHTALHIRNDQTEYPLW